MKKWFLTDLTSGILVGIFFIIAYAAFMIYHAIVPSDETLDDVPAREILSGTIDYTLKSKWLQDKAPYEWVLRLPDDQFVIEGKDNGSLMLFFDDWNLDNYLRKSEATKINPYQLSNVSVSSSENPQFSQLQESYVQRLPCSKATPVNESVEKFEYLQMAVANDAGSFDCEGLDRPTVGDAVYLARSANGEVIGQVECVGSAKPDAICSGRLSVLGFREVSLMLKSSSVPELLTIQRAVDDYLKKQTVRIDRSEYLSKLRGKTTTP